ncbi:MAG: hypothetical protein AAGC79_02220 [Pseudomonadota bacterium]
MQKTILKLILFGGAMLLGACATPVPQENTTSIRATDAGRGVDVYAMRRQAGETVPNLLDTQTITVRAFAAKPRGTTNFEKGEELIGANCLASLDGGVAELTTPAELTLPLYGVQTQPLRIECINPGFKDGWTNLAPYNYTEETDSTPVVLPLSPIAIIPALIGSAIAIGIDAAIDSAINEEDEFRYRDADILLYKGQGSDQLPKPQVTAPELAALTGPGSSVSSAAPAQPSFPEVEGSPPLTEGTPYSAFTKEQIAAYCAQDWATRTRDDGRTEFNPCSRRDAFN